MTDTQMEAKFFGERNIASLQSATSKHYVSG